MKIADRPFRVVLCSHNGEQFIEEQIDSILQQGDEIDAIHIHDFASLDGTRTVLERLQKTAGNKLSITHHADAPGTAASFVRALRLTAPSLPDGSMIFLADQDDVWLPNKLETIQAELAERRLSAGVPFVLFHDVHVVDEKLTLMRPTYYTGNPFRVPRDLDRARLLMANPAIGHTMLISVPLVRKLVTWPDVDRYLMHDWLAILIASRLGRIEQIPVALSLYRQHGNNVLGAYRTGGKFASVSRLLDFVDRVVGQAVAFSRAAHALRRTPGACAIEDSRLEALCRRGYRSAAAALSVKAVTHGPTWQRKALGALLLLRAIIGTTDKRAGWRQS